MADLEKKLSATKVIKKKARTSPAASKERLAEDLENDIDDIPQGKQVNGEEFAAEYDVRHPTGEKMRDKVRTLLCDAMFKKDEDWVKDRKEAQIVANAIEAGMSEKLGAKTPAYKSKYRNLQFNLKDPKNGQLRMAVLQRLIPPSELLEMSNEDLANDELKKTREEVHQKMTRDAMPYNKQEASTNMFKCGKCKERKCTYYQMQTRSADEPLTTFVSCVNCGNRWRF